MGTKQSPRRRDQTASGDKSKNSKHRNNNQSPDQPQAVRLALLANGYAPLPAKGKEVHLPGWTSLAPTEEMVRGWTHHAKWASYTNSGILNCYNPAIDIDIKDEPAAEALEILVRERFGNGGGRLLRRTGMHPKRAFLFRTDVPFDKLWEEFIAPDGSKHKIEILCDGQQIISHGIHPDTQKPYVWHGGEPWNGVPSAELVTLTAAAARAWLDEATAYLVGEGWGHIEKSPTPDTDDGDGGDFPLIVKLGFDADKPEVSWLAAKMRSDR